MIAVVRCRAVARVGREGRSPRAQILEGRKNQEKLTAVYFNPILSGCSCFQTLSKYLTRLVYCVVFCNFFCLWGGGGEGGAPIEQNNILAPTLFQACCGPDQMSGNQ